MKTRIILTLLILTLTACAPATNPAISMTSIQSTAFAAAYTGVALTPIAPPTATPVPPTFTPIVTQFAPIPTFTSISTLNIPFTLDAIRMAYVVDGNLYLQDGSNQPIQLTNSGKDHSPIFSDDGEKVVFFRGTLPHNVYSINTDGSQEQELVSSELLTALDMEYYNSTELRSLSFVPGTHQILFNTHELDWLTLSTKDINRSGAKPNQDLLLVNTDTSVIKRILEPGQGGIFQVSPNGKLVIIQAIDHIDVIGLDGKIIHRNLATYPSSWLYDRWPDIYWTQDSGKLNLVLPLDTGNALDSSGPEPRTIWQYSMDGKSAVEIHLNPPPIGESFSISPDGNWVVYTYYYYPGKTDETVASGIYIGNLRDGSSQFLESAQLYGIPNSFYWSSDNVHFIFENEQSLLFLGNVNGTTTSLNGGAFLGWIDTNHYLYLFSKIFLGEIGNKTNLFVSDMPIPIHNTNPFIFVFLK